MRARTISRFVVNTSETCIPSLAACCRQVRYLAAGCDEVHSIGKVSRGDVDMARMTFSSSASVLSTQFEANRIAQVEASTDLVVQSRKMNTVALTLNRPDKKNALSEAVRLFPCHLHGAAPANPKV
jgi:hypothetical protein